MKYLLLIALCLIPFETHAACIAGCPQNAAAGATVATSASKEAVAAPAAAPQSLKTDLINDLQTAGVLACAKSDAGVVADELGCACYPVLATYLGSVTPANAPAVVGPISGFEVARLKANKLQAGVPSELKAACGGLVLDVNEKIVNIGAMLAALGLRL